MATAPQLRECLANVNNHKVVIDLRAVSFLDSSGIACSSAHVSGNSPPTANFTLRKAQGIVLTALTIVGLADWVED